MAKDTDVTMVHGCTTECFVIWTTCLASIYKVILMFIPSHSRCRPCVRIAPAFNMLSNKYPQVVFLEVDVHVCQVYNKEKKPSGLT